MGAESLILCAFGYNCSFVVIVVDLIALQHAQIYSNLKSVRELIYKRGYGKLNKQAEDPFDRQFHH